MGGGIRPQTHQPPINLDTNRRGEVAGRVGKGLIPMPITPLLFYNVRRKFWPSTITFLIAINKNVFTLIKSCNYWLIVDSITTIIYNTKIVQKITRCCGGVVLVVLSEYNGGYSTYS